MTCLWHDDGSRIPVTILEVRSPHRPHLPPFPRSLLRSLLLSVRGHNFQLEDLRRTTIDSER